MMVISIRMRLPALMLTGVMTSACASAFSASRSFDVPPGREQVQVLQRAAASNPGQVTFHDGSVVGPVKLEFRNDGVRTADGSRIFEYQSVQHVTFPASISRRLIIRAHWGAAFGAAAASVWYLIDRDEHDAFNTLGPVGIGVGAIYGALVPMERTFSFRGGPSIGVSMRPASGVPTAVIRLAF